MALSLVLLADPAQAFELGLGYGAVEQGDDRLEPAVVLHAAIDSYVLNIYYYGREFGPVRQDNVIVGAAYRWSIFGSSGLSANLGVSLIEEHIRIKYSDTTYAQKNNVEDNFNVGVNFGVAWAFVPKFLSPFWGQVAWDSHIYAAGVEGGILLSSGRKQAITLAVGVELK